MIECSEKNIWYKKRRKSNLKRCFSIFCVFAIIIGLLCYYKYVVSELIINICAEYAYSYSTDAVNKAIFEIFENSIKYENLINIEKNNDGNIVLLSANSIFINRLSSNISLTTKEILANSLEKGVPVPALAFTGVDFFAGYGKIIDFKTLSVSSVNCEFQSEFNGMGVNQTLHSIYILITSNVTVNLPFNTQEKRCVTEVLVCETVLVGDVPETYLNGTIFPK